MSTQENLVGLSFKGCVRDIAEGRVSINQVLCIHAPEDTFESTMHEAQLKRLLQEYYFGEEALGIAIELIKTNRVNTNPLEEAYAAQALERIKSLPAGSRWFDRNTGLSFDVTLPRHRGRPPRKSAVAVR